MKGRLPYFLPLLLMIFSCEKKEMQIPHEIDLFAQERREGKAYIMSAQECFDASDLVVSTAGIKLVDSSTGRGRSFFIYKINSGEILKSTRDSVLGFPFQMVSSQRLKLKNEPIYVYLKKLQGYRFIAEEKKLKYQWLKGASVYTVKEEN